MSGSGCLYIPGFSAWALARASPGDGPVVVVVAGRAVVWTRAISLREVREGDRPDRILRLCPEARVRVRNASVEAACWDEVLEGLQSITPFIATSRPPFAYFRAEGEPELHTLARDLGIQVGLGPDRETARLAAVRAAGRHVLRVPSEHRRTFLDRFPMRMLTELGYPEELPDHLALFGYPFLGSITHLTRRHLEGQFGEYGGALYTLLHPEPDPPVPLYVPPPAITNEFEPESSIDPGEVTPIVHLLVKRGSEALGERRTQRMVIELHMPHPPLVRRASRLLSEPHHEAATLFRFATRLVEETVQPGDRIERVVLRLEALRRPSVHQASLFDARPAVLGAVRRVHQRYPEAIRRAVHRPHVLFPEDTALFEPYAETEQMARIIDRARTGNRWKPT